MKYIILIPLILFVLNLSAQNSDLENSKHEIIFIGDSVYLKKVMKQLGDIIPDKSEICDLTIKDFGEYKEQKLQIVYIDMSIGISCRGLKRTAFLKAGKFLGYFDSDISTPVKLINDNLIWDVNGQKTIMMLTNGVPEDFDVGFDGIKRLFVK